MSGECFPAMSVVFYVIVLLSHLHVFIPFIYHLLLFSGRLKFMRNLYLPNPAISFVVFLFFCILLRECRNYNIQDGAET